MKNARIFINAYNKIDDALRALYNFKSNQGFSDMVRRSAERNIIVRKYENELIDYARLRNAIVHKSIDEKIIAEPSDEVTEKILLIERLLTSPPKINEVFKERKISGVDEGISLKELILLTGRTGYSNFPVYSKGIMIGVINPKRVVRAISKVITENKSVDDFLQKSRCGEVISAQDMTDYYAVLSNNHPIDKVAQEYENNKKLRAVLVTANGIAGETVINILTPADLTKVNKILEDY